MALFAKTVRDVIGILSIILNQQDLHAAARFLTSVRYPASRETRS